MNKAIRSVGVMEITAALLVCLALAGCCPPKYIYASAPRNLIPPAPELPKIESAALQCLSDDAYTKLAERDRALRQNNAELRALLEVSNATGAR